MAASYFMGSRSGTAKKSGNWYGCFYILHINQYNQWSIDSFWLPDEDTYTILSDGLAIGVAVRLALNTEMKVTDCEVLDEPAPLPLAPLG